MGFIEVRCAFEIEMKEFSGSQFFGIDLYRKPRNAIFSSLLQIHAQKKFPILPEIFFLLCFEQFLLFLQPFYRSSFHLSKFDKNASSYKKSAEYSRYRSKSSFNARFHCPDAIVRNNVFAVTLEERLPE